MKFHSSKYFVEGIEKIPLSALASMIFLYKNGSKGGPFIRITVYESTENQYNYVVEWDTTDGIEAISGGLAMTRDDGFNASQVFVNYVYSFSTTWKESPTLLEVFGGESVSRNTIGFNLEGS